MKISHICTAKPGEIVYDIPEEVLAEAIVGLIQTNQTVRDALVEFLGGQ